MPSDGAGTARVTVPEGLTLGGDPAARVGMTTIALVMNAVRYGGVALQVELEKDQDTLTLSVAYDDKRPAPTGYDLRDHGTGARLIRVLAGHQSLSRDPVDPRRVRVRFDL